MTDFPGEFFPLLIQEALGGKERERALKQEIQRIQVELEKEKVKTKNANDKVSMYSEQVN